MDINYLILAHYRPAQLCRLVMRLDDENSRFYIHIDKRNNLNDFQAELKQSNVIFLQKRENCLWGDISLVRATLLGMRAMLADKRKGYCILLSGLDYPIKSNTAIDRYLEENLGYDFVDLTPIDKLWRDSWSQRAEYYKFDLSDTRENLVLIPSIWNNKFYSLYNFGKIWKVLKTGNLNIFRILKKRKFPSYFIPFGGSQWWALTMETMEKVIDFLDKHPDYLEYHRFSFCSDEFFFHSILHYFSESGQIKTKTNLTFINWKAQNKTSPAILGIQDLEALLKKPDYQLFARKFDATKDTAILDRLDEIANGQLLKS